MKPKTITQYKDTNQMHVSLAFPTPGRYAESKYATMLLSTALGGGISSRLFQKVREEKGLAYTVYSQLEQFSDVGMFAIYLGSHPKHITSAVKVTSDIISDVYAHGITKSELKRAKSSLQGAIVLGLEDVHSRMTRLGTHELNYGFYWPVSETLLALEAVTLEEVARAARKVFANKPASVLIGPMRNKKKRQKVFNDLPYPLA